MLLKTLRHLTPRSSRRRNSRRTAHGSQSPAGLAQVLENRTLLAAQIFRTDPAGPLEVTAGNQFEFDVVIETDPQVLGAGASFRVHWNGEKVRFVEVKDIAANAVTVPGGVEPDNDNADGIDETNVRIPNTFSTFASFTFPETVTAFTAVFTANATFAEGDSTQIGFSEINPGNDINGDQFEFMQQPLTINSVAAVDIAVDDDFMTTLNDPFMGNVLNNDNGTGLTAALATGPTNGSVTVSANGDFTYTPNTGFSGTDTFTYTATDAGSQTDTATVTMTVVDPPPDAVDDEFTVLAGRTLEGNVLDNDTDPDNQTLTAALVTDVANGTLALNADGSFTYMPDAGFLGTDMFTYSATDEGGNVVNATATITVNDIPDIAGDGNIKVGWKRGSLWMKGDHGNNSVLVEGDGTTISIIGLGNTTINGQMDPVVLNIATLPDDLKIGMRKGNDTVLIRDLSVGGSIKAALNRDNDRMVVMDSNVGDDVVIVGGHGDDLINVLNTTIGDDVRLAASGGSDVVLLDDSTVGDDALLRGGARHDLLGVSNSAVGDDLTIRGNGGRDQAQIVGTTVGDRQKIHSSATGNDVDAVFADVRMQIADALLGFTTTAGQAETPATAAAVIESDSAADFSSTVSAELSDGDQSEADDSAVGGSIGSDLDDELFFLS